MINQKIKQLVRPGIYLIVLTAIAIFLYRLGEEPWVLVSEHMGTLFIIMLATGAGILVQAEAFRTSYPVNTTPLSIIETFRIWSASAVVSVVTPIFTGIATRTTLLVRAGTPLSVCMIASTRQVWMGLEYAALIGGIAMGLLDYSFAKKISILAIVLWLVMMFIRMSVATKGNQDLPTKIGRYIFSLRSSYPISAHVWFVLQLFLMSTVYYFGFHGVGASLSWNEAFALSGVTVFISLIALVPNGLGLTDALWVVVGMHTGLTLEASVSLAILIRMGHLVSAALVYLVIYLFRVGRFRPVG
ncbi:MAG: flippase-like domain-containing protein [Candidatus Thiodiazotropha sp. (ex Dulcina madagascariensis)]|nr:flippase-like domain-containing protein [Candidatus Thiodiazotropha sp. (ex Dulcina madagascariensis)]